MTLRQEYAGPRPRAIARRPDQPARAAAPAHTGPAGFSPPRQPGLGATAVATRPTKGRPCPSPRPAGGLRPQPRAGHRLDPRRDYATPATPPFPATRTRRGSCRSRRHPAPPVPVTGGLPRSLRRWIRIQRLLPQVAGTGPVPVGVLWVTRRPLRVVNPPAARDGETSRDSGPPGTATANPARHHQGERNAPGPALTESPKPRPPARNGRRSRAEPSPRPGRPHPPAGGKLVSWTGRERLRCLWYRLRLTVAEMNYATRRVVEVQAPWICDSHPRH